MEFRNSLSVTFKLINDEISLITLDTKPFYIIRDELEHYQYDELIDIFYYYELVPDIWIGQLASIKYANLDDYNYLLSLYH